MEEVPRPARVRMLLSFAAGSLLAVLALVVVEAEPTEASSRYEDLGLFSSVVDHVRRHYVDSIDEHDCGEHGAGRADGCRRVRAEQHSR